jgi:hypothetical protein
MVSDESISDSDYIAGIRKSILTTLRESSEPLSLRHLTRELFEGRVTRAAQLDVLDDLRYLGKKRKVEGTKPKWYVDAQATHYHQKPLPQGFYLEYSLKPEVKV